MAFEVQALILEYDKTDPRYAQASEQYYKLKAATKDFVVARRILDVEEDAITLEPLFLIQGALPETTVSEVRDVLIAVGRFSQESWREYKVVPEEDISYGSSKGQWTEDPYDWVMCRLDPFNSITNSMPSMPGEMGAGEHYDVRYDDLLDRISDEKRITLRLPLGLHTKLSQAAKEMTLNAFCLQILANAVEYENLEEFEAKQRKPGRPKKTEAAA